MQRSHLLHSRGQLFQYMFQFNLFTLMSISNKIILIIPTQHSRPKIHLQPNKFIISSTRIVSTVIEGLKCIFIIFFGKPKWMSMFSQCNIFAAIYKCKQNMNNVYHVIGFANWFHRIHSTLSVNYEFNGGNSDTQFHSFSIYNNGNQCQ